MKSQKIYIAGCGGMLGEAFYRVFKKNYILQCSDIDMNEKWLTYCDFRDFYEYRRDVISFKPDYLIHLGAHTDLEFCEQNVDDTYLTNTLSVEHACFIAKELNIPLVYISTAGIFDGSKDIFDDWDVPNPMCHYARSKYAGEVIVKENMSKYLILRPGWMMGGGPKKDKKFINKMFRQIKSGSKTLFAVNDRQGTPTYTDDFAKNSMFLLEKNICGLYNMVCTGITSRLEVTLEMLKVLNLEETIKVQEVDSEYFSKEYFVRRPYSERLLNRKLNLKNLNMMRNWKLCLKEYLEKDYIDYMNAQQ